MDRATQLYRMMARIRAFENAAEEASRGSVAAFGASLAQSNIRGPLHLSTGQEAVAAGVCIHLTPDDLLTSTHRGHGHTLAKGAAMEPMMAELFGRASGPNKGKGGSMHIADFSVGMLGANGVVADGMPIAVGAAHAIKIKKEQRLVACFFGDGAINRGPFLEALNWAAIHALPVLFVCEDNRWSATTPADAMTAGEGALARAEAIGVPGVQVDGNDVFAVDEAAAAKHLGADARPVLDAAIAVLEPLPDWRTESIKAALEGALVDRLGLKPRKAYGPVRVAVTGSPISPPLFESLDLLGRDATLRRLRGAVPE